MIWLRQATSVVVHFGPFVDKTDAVTPETGLVSALDSVVSGILIAKNGAAAALRNPLAGSPTMVTPSVYDSAGMYRVTLDAVDTAAAGVLRMMYSDPATCLPVWEDFLVLPAQVYDSIVLGTDLLDINAEQIDGDADAASNARRNALGTVTGTVGTGSTTTLIVTNGIVPASNAADQFKGRIVTFDKNTTTVSLRGQSTDITASANAGSPATGTLTVTALTTAPQAGDTFTIT